MSRDQEINTSRPADFSRSFGFWAALTAALGLYGLAVLSPKLAGREQLLTESHSLRVQLSRHEQKLTRLRQAAASLQHDPRFAEDLLRRDSESRPPGDEEIIPLEGDLVYRKNAPGQQASPAPAVRKPPWYAPLLTAIGHSSDIRGVLLLSSVVLILFAFGFLQRPESVGGNSDRVEADEIPRKPDLLTRWLSRYDRSEDVTERRKLRERLAAREADKDWEKDALPIVSFDDGDS